MQPNNNNSHNMYRHQMMQNAQNNGNGSQGSGTLGQLNIPLQDIASGSGMSSQENQVISPHTSGISPHSASGISPHSASGISPHSASGISPHSASGFSPQGGSGMSHFAYTGYHHMAPHSGYQQYGYSFGVPTGHSSHYAGPSVHHGNPGPSGYHGHAAAAAPHMYPAHQGHAGQSLHPWYQTMPQVGSPYCMQEETNMPNMPNMWQYNAAMDFLGHNLFPMGQAMSQQHQQYDQRLDDVSRLPSPSTSLSPSEQSSPGVENTTPTSSPNLPNGSNHPSQLQGAHGITCGGGPMRNGGRPNINRSPFEWMKKSSYQSQPNPEDSPLSDFVLLENSVALETNGKTRTKDKYRVVYTDHQRIELEKEFTFNNKYITIRRKSELATKLGLSERQIKIWFQNRRAKERKQAKKRQEERNAMHTRRIARNFAAYPGLVHALEDPNIVNNPLPPAGALQLQEHLRSHPVNVTASGGILTPPGGSQDALQPGCSYTQNQTHLPTHRKDDSDDHGTVG